MTLTELRPGLWGWAGSAAHAIAAAVLAIDAGGPGRDLIVVDDSTGVTPRLGAHVFVTAAGRGLLGAAADHLGDLAPLDYWFRAHLDHATVHHEVGETNPGSAGAASALEVTELVHRHLGYLPVGWATAAAVRDGERSAVDFLQAYNYSVVAQERMADDVQAHETLGICERLDLEIAEHCHRAATKEEIELEVSVPRKVGPQFWAFDRPWYREQRNKWHGLIESERDDPRPFVIAGNGPSLRDSLTEIAATGTTIRLVTSNFAVLEPELATHSHVHTVVNYMVAEQAAGLINLLPTTVTVVVPFWLSYCIRPRSNVYFTETSADLRFSGDVAKEISWIHTVSFYAMQLAAGLSAGDAALVGFDHQYDQPAAIEEGAEIVDAGPDTNHFRDDYFSGKRWQAADVDMMETVYRLADEHFSSESRTIVNCTAGGSLEVFPRSSLGDFVRDQRQ